MPSMMPCPVCGKYRFHKSHTRNIREKLRKHFLHQQPYRCHACGYRGFVSRAVLKSKKDAKQYLLYLAVIIIAIIVSILMRRFML